MNNLKMKHTENIVQKEKNFRYYKLNNSILNITMEKKKLKLCANANNEFLDLHSLKTNRILIPIINSFKYHNSKIYLFEVQMLYKTKTAEIKKSLINLTDELCCSFNISRNDTQSLYRLIIRYTNFTKFDQIEYYLNNQRIAA
jgi:hypothetical protein